MTNDAVLAALAERKATLLLDGAVYRLGIYQAKATVVHGLHLESLAQRAIEHAVGIAGARLGLALTNGVGC